MVDMLTISSLLTYLSILWQDGSIKPSFWPRKIHEFLKIFYLLSNVITFVCTKLFGEISPFMPYPHHYLACLRGIWSYVTTIMYVLGSLIPYLLWISWFSLSRCYFIDLSHITEQLNYALWTFNESNFNDQE